MMYNIMAHLKCPVDMDTTIMAHLTYIHSKLMSDLEKMEQAEQKNRKRK